MLSQTKTVKKYCVSDSSVKVIPGKYGPRHYDCHCEGHCHPGTGACQGACRQGWAGPTCQINTSMSDHIIIAIPDRDDLCYTWCFFHFSDLDKARIFIFF